MLLCMGFTIGTLHGGLASWTGCSLQYWYPGAAHMLHTACTIGTPGAVAVVAGLASRVGVDAGHTIGTLGATDTLGAARTLHTAAAVVVVAGLPLTSASEVVP